MSALRTFTPMTILRLAASRLICSGPLTRSMLATSLTGICMSSDVRTVRALRSRSFTSSWSRRTTRSKRRSFSNTTPAVSPAYAVRMIEFSSSMSMPYRAILFRSKCTTNCGRPTACSTITSAAPGTLFIYEAASLAFS